MGPEGFHRRFVASGAAQGGSARMVWSGQAPVLLLTGKGAARVDLGQGEQGVSVDGEHRIRIEGMDANQTYDLSVEAGGWRSEFAGRVPAAPSKA